MSVGALQDSLGMAEYAQVFLDGHIIESKKYTTSLHVQMWMNAKRKVPDVTPTLAVSMGMAVTSVCVTVATGPGAGCAWVSSVCGVSSGTS